MTETTYTWDQIAQAIERHQDSLISQVPQGNLRLAMIGKIQAAGNSLKRHLKDYLENPVKEKKV